MGFKNILVHDQSEIVAIMLLTIFFNKIKEAKSLVFYFLASVFFQPLPQRLVGMTR